MDSGDNWMAVEKLDPGLRWPVLTTCPEAVNWLEIQANLGLARRTIEAYARGLADYFAVCDRDGVDPLTAERAAIARYVRDLTRRPNHRGANVVAFDSGVGLANATLQQRLVAVRLFYDHLIEEGRRETNPVGRGRYTPGKGVWWLSRPRVWCRVSRSCPGFPPTSSGVPFWRLPKRRHCAIA